MFSMTMEEWVRQQHRSPWHWGTLGVFAVLLWLSLRGVYGQVPPKVLIAWGVFLLVESWPLLGPMLLAFVIMTGLALAHPALGALLALIGIIFFLLRIRFVIRNILPIGLGILMYSVCYLLVGDHLVLQVVNEIYFRLPLHQISFTLRDGILLAVLALGTLLPTALFHWCLTECYKKGYEVRGAVSIMVGVPLLILSFILPFLKVLTGLESGAFADHGGTFHGGDGHIQPAHDPGLHHVNGHFRSSPNGPVYVHGHWQTNPDGVLENNLSYHGPVTPQGTGSNAAGAGAEGLSGAAAAGKFPAGDAGPLRDPGKPGTKKS
jgi:hypothetical protein